MVAYYLLEISCSITKLLRMSFYRLVWLCYTENLLNGGLILCDAATFARTANEYLW